MRPTRITFALSILTSALALRANVESPFEQAVVVARRAIEVGNWDEARAQIGRALERDPKSPLVWDLRAQWAEGVSDRDELVWSLHVRHRLLVAQRAPRAEIEALMRRIAAVDPVAEELWKLKLSFSKRVEPIAERYEKDGRPHSAIRAHRLLLALDPERETSRLAIERISAAPDPSLAESAKPKDLLADVSEEWIREHDAAHATWDTRASMKRENYTTYTDAGYEVLVRSAEAMEQMNAFYRRFFRYGGPDDKKKVSRIDLNIFKTRDEYLTLGIGPPVEWSGGHFTGGAVETYIGDGGFEQTVGTLFHEAAHQFVSLATNAAGWLNEGLASYFEGCRILANGTVQMNLPANHRLFPLAERMEKGWMTSPSDGIDPANASGSNPEKAPTFQIVLENRYAWGPPWYAPTWGVVYFLWNFQDPVDGRFVYRAAFQEFIDKSGGRVGEGAVSNFEEVVLANPAPRTPKVDAKLWKDATALPRTCDELNEVWKTWMLALRDEQSGKEAPPRPWLDWARHAITRSDFDVAAEHFEKGLVAAPEDPSIRVEFGKLLVSQWRNTDRAAKLVLEAARLAEAMVPPDEVLARQCDRLLQQWDPKFAALERLQEQLASGARNLARRYLDAGLSLPSMELSYHLANEMGIASLWDDYETALRRSGKTLSIWKLAYNERNLGGWATQGDTTFQPNGEQLVSRFGDYEEDRFDFKFLTLDTVTSGDFSMEAEVVADAGRVNFCGLVFGRKNSSTFHAMLLFPPRRAEGRDGTTGFVQLASFFGASQFKIWRNNPVAAAPVTAGTAASSWHRMRLDVTGRMADLWFDGRLVVSHEFPSLDVLRGGFGLITGPGSAQYRNLRYLARPALDRGSALERSVRLGARAEGAAGADGSWLGSVPPFPRVTRWIGEPRSTWRDRGAVPTVLVLWSKAQNERIPVDAWLRSVAERHADAELQVVSVVSAHDDKEIDAYLQAHPFPGSVGVDAKEREFLGDTFGAYSIPTFGMPRVLLLDLDGRVAWEGDPGFRGGVAWAPGDPSYLDDPLAELLEKRKVRELVAWRRAWVEKGIDSMHAGRIADAAELLRGASRFDASLDPVVAEARDRIAAVEGALGALETLETTFADWRVEPAIETLVDWGKALGIEVSADAKRAAGSAHSSERGRDWSRAVAILRAQSPGMTAGREIAVAERMLLSLDSLSGPFANQLATELQSLVAYGDVAAILSLVADAEGIPARWLAQRYFGW